MAQKSSHAYSFAKHELPSGPSRESCSLRDGFEFRGQEKPMLCGAAETISAWRVEIEERAEALGSFAADCLLARTGFELGPIKSETLHSERALTARRADGLRMRREELLAQLHAVEEELQEVESRDAELNRRESHLKNSMARVSTELAEQRETCQENGLVAACRQRLLLSTVETSKTVEEPWQKQKEATSDGLQPSISLPNCIGS
ncbi:unnamed protein product [Durusdinium trenchii]|uniref:Uncharacterized protein n=1 Tax=Durusdinium trenchii TaxID=1381693 RepID=A0ABP0Q1V7_9DINO